MSAAELRAAAALMRERAEAVTSGAQWTGGHYWVEDYDPSDPSGQTGMQRLIGGMDPPDGEHYSSWHPTVALAVADWLDACAELLRPDWINEDDLIYAPALHLARAYLGTADP